MNLQQPLLSCSLIHRAMAIFSVTLDIFDKKVKAKKCTVSYGEPRMND